MIPLLSETSTPSLHPLDIFSDLKIQQCQHASPMPHVFLGWRGYPQEDAEKQIDLLFILFQGSNVVVAANSQGTIKVRHS